MTQIDELEQAVQAWSAEGRTEEQIYGVRNFVTSKHFAALLDRKDEPQLRDELKEAWQEFEREYRISDNYQPHEQIIYTAFYAGANAAAYLSTEKQRWTEELLEKKHLYNVKSTDGVMNEPNTGILAVPVEVIQEHVKEESDG